MGGRCAGMARQKRGITMRTYQKTMILLPMLMLAACGSGSSDGDPTTPDGDVGLCPYVTGGSITFTPACADCEIVNEELAHDGNPNTYASVIFPATSGGAVSLRVSAADGVTYGALTPAGVIYGFTGPSSTLVYKDLHITAYLDGVPVGIDQSVSPSIITGGGDREPERYQALMAGPYNEVELDYMQVSGTEMQTLNVFEFCGGQ